MNAVERLLGQGEQVLSLFDEMFIDRIGSGRPVELPDVPPGLIYTVGHMVIDAMPTEQYWSSADWLQAAAEAAWLELKQQKKPASREQLASRTAELFRDYLAKREQILSRDTWRRLLADVVFESRAWEPLSANVVSLCEQVAREVRRVEGVAGDIEPLDWERRKRAKLRKALDLLHPYSQPPKADGRRSAKRADSGKPVGRPQNDEVHARDLLAGWTAFEPEEGRKTKDRYLAQRPDVRVLKGEDARRRKIASLRVALDSALHLRREKTKQKRQSRG
jgi:hypothetical protein